MSNQAGMGLLSARDWWMGRDEHKKTGLSCVMDVLFFWWWVIMAQEQIWFDGSKKGCGSFDGPGKHGFGLPGCGQGGQDREGLLL